jgi:hypothetical protein
MNCGKNATKNKTILGLPKPTSSPLANDCRLAGRDPIGAASGPACGLRHAGHAEIDQVGDPTPFRRPEPLPIPARSASGRSCRCRSVSLSDFRKAAAERDVMKVSPFDAGPWETLDREDLLPPVAYAIMMP